MSRIVAPDALAAHRPLHARDWIATQDAVFDRRLQPPAESWPGEEPDAGQAAAGAAEDGWRLQWLGEMPSAAVEARGFDAGDAPQRGELFAWLPPAGEDPAASPAWAQRALPRRGLRLRIGAGESRLRLDRRAVAAVEEPMLLLELESGASCVLFESHAPAGTEPAAQNLQVHVHLARGARLQHLRQVSAGRSDRITQQLQVRLEEEAHYAQALLATGSGYHLQRCRVELNGARAAARVHAVLLAAGSTLEQQIEFRHAAPQTHSSAEVLALASGAARLVGSALSHIAPGCDDADVRQKLVGIPTAGQPRIVLRPHLQIHHDQVQAAHGATWGALAEEALFFARQRGLDEAAAKALILQGLAHAALVRSVDDDALPEALSLQAALHDAVACHLGAAATTATRQTSHG